MKRRSHRLPRPDSHDDWVDGSWTVDCICGVNFDDGEEMVYCDECGVWVHTRCSRYVKSDQSFACDKCKSTRNNISKETEVAQLLVDLPNKTLQMDHPYPSNVPSRRSVKLCTQKTIIEERVHVHGVPGGDPSLFAGLSSVFSPQLWKSTGYVPKKFNFQYREFPSRNKEEAKQVEKSNGVGNENTDENENTAGVLFSLLNDVMPPSPLASSVGVKSLAEDEKAQEGASSEQRKRLNKEEVDASSAQNVEKKDSSSTQTTEVNSVKCKEDIFSSQDGSEKKRARRIENEGVSKNKTKLTSTAASTFSSDGKQFKFYDDRGPKATKANTESSKTGVSENSTPADNLSNGSQNGGINANNDKEHPGADEPFLGTKLFDSSRCNANSDRSLKKGVDEDQVPSKVETSSKVHEVVSDTPDILNDNRRGSEQRKKIESQESKPVVENMAVTRPEVEVCRISQSFSCEVIAGSEPNIGVKEQAVANHAANVHHLPLHEKRLDSIKLSAQQLEVPAINSSETIKMNDAAISSSESSDQMQDVDRSTADGILVKDKVGSLAGGHQSKPEETGSEGSLGVRDTSSGLTGLTGSECSLRARKISTGHKPSSKSLEGIAKLDARTSSSDLHQCKLVAGKSSSETSKSSTSGSRSSVNVQTQSTNSKQRDANFGIKKETGLSIVVRDEHRTERSKKITKDTPKSSLSSSSKVFQSSKFSYAPVHKRCSTDSKDFALHSSSRSSRAPGVTATRGSGESAVSLKSVGAFNVQNKSVGSGLPRKSEKTNQPDAQSLPEVNASQMQPPASSNPPTGLSDEELALLLHQELNSSSRVTRVPRMRHAGSLLQLTSPTAASMLMKRTSSSGGKDCSSANRRKPKESSKDGSHSTFDEAQMVARVSTSLDRGQDSVCTTDPLTKREVDGGLQKDLVRKNYPPASTATANCGLSSFTEVNDNKESSARTLPRHASDGESGAVGRPTPVTLPGLIAKIMSKGERMTYEELCNAVLPHWSHLRKHNGERYAYSSHSQAVLDCLRNRNEWARLVDRGPKTSTSRKRHKLDADLSGAALEDDGGGSERTRNDGGSKSLESQREEFPKGKRQARKRRRLALQGKGINDRRGRPPRRAEVLSDEEVGSISDSSGDDSMFSEDKMRGGETAASASSNETET